MATTTPDLAPWTKAERLIFRRPKRVPVPEWAHERFHLSPPSKVTGPVDLSVNPWQKGILEAYSDRRIRKIVIQKSVQSGVTTALMIMACYAVTQRPGDIIWAVPHKADVTHFSKNRWATAVAAQPYLRDLRTGRASDETKRQYRFRTCSIYFRHAASKQELASDPAPNVFGDEVDKWQEWAGDEGNPLRLLEDRTTTFNDRKIVFLSTPSLVDGHIHRQFLLGDQRRYHVPCPHCGEYQHLVFEQIKCDPHLRRDLAKLKRTNAAWYECKHCHKAIEDTQANKEWMFSRGQWVQEGARVLPDGTSEGAYESDTASFHISMLYVPNAWRSWSDILARFFEVRHNPSDLMVFINQWLGEPWVEKRKKTTESVILRTRGSHKLGEVPRGVGLIVAGVDVQRDHFWWILRGFGAQRQSWLLEAKRVETWAELGRLLYRDIEGLQILRACIDSGDGETTFDVYDFCRQHADVAIPTKGMSHDTGLPVRTAVISRDWRNGMPLSEGLKLWHVNTTFFKDQLSALIDPLETDERRWWSAGDISDEYVRNMTSEEKVRMVARSGIHKGKATWAWKRVSDSHPNHWWDCEVLCLFAAHTLGADTMEDEDVQRIRVDSDVRRAEIEMRKQDPRRTRHREEQGQRDSGGLWHPGESLWT